MIQAIKAFIRDVWINLRENRTLFSERKYSWVVADQIKTSSFPLFIGAALGMIIAVIYDGKNLFIVQIFEEFFQFKTLGIIIYIAVGAVIALWIAAAFKKRKLANYLEYLLNWLLYWCFVTSSVIVAILIGGSLPFYLCIIDSGSQERVNQFQLFAVLVPSLFYLMSIWANKGVRHFSER